MSKEEQFVTELIGYIFAYPDDDYMTMECLCRKLHKYGLIDKKDGEWTTDFIERKDEPQKRCDECIHFDKTYKKRDKDGTLIIGVECDGMDEPCDKWTDEPQTERSEE